MSNTDTKTALLDCAQDLIQRVGVNAMSYKHLSDEIGIRKASIHYHFPKKEDLIVALLCKCRDEYDAMYNQIVASDNDAKRKLYMISELFEQSLRNGKICIVGMLSVEFESLGETVWQTLQTSIKNSSKIYEKIFVQAVGEDAVASDINTYDAAYGYFSFLLGTQVLSRCMNDTDQFKKSVAVYIESLQGN
jgi:TetR/AcrR family transcriptional regulator, transcriptional repressor for nem operon